jgi:hypothetical protein
MTEVLRSADIYNDSMKKAESLNSRLCLFWDTVLFSDLFADFIFLMIQLFLLFLRYVTAIFSCHRTFFLANVAIFLMQFVAASPFDILPSLTSF